MVNINGNISSSAEAEFLLKNRGFHYGDALFESMRWVKNKIIFWDDHYHRLLESMRVLKMKIPTNFTAHFLYNEVQKIIHDSAPKRIKLMVWRNWGGKYTPDTNSVSYCIFAENLTAENYRIPQWIYRIGVYKEHRINPNLLSTLKTTNKMIHVLGSIYAREHNLDNGILLNEKMNVTEALNGNIIVVSGGKIQTPPLSEGCLNGVLRKQLFKHNAVITGFKIEEKPLRLDDLFKADELWITNSVLGIIPVTDFDGIKYSKILAERVTAILNRIATGV